ncbi:holo-[acyl-carrier-protein] synthase [Desulfovibrio sp.]|uniref:holo-[acyl-carrier-protein] synthase n=1 Tax=Desulfovibrio sp. TaxID=885 RepID=UPI0023CB0B4B|nr:holo-[acyl-carrier-protein] synthase [Desulfovibrio sp.]MDE7240689.1 holo-[acyl-carrier-protein] synthase [Desulfovibrio sp.]
MIVGLGIDMTELERIRKVHARFGRRFLEKFLAPDELAALPAQPRVSLLAGRFAAKEAAAKALGTGFSGGLGPCQMEVAHTPAGAPTLVFHGAAAQRAAGLGTRAIHLSISHERSHAVAVVVLEA